MIPTWLHVLSIAMLVLGVVCALIIVVDLLRGHAQQMWIMNVVWPVCALFATGFALWAYFQYGRLATKKKMQAAMENDEEPPSKKHTPFPAMVMKGAAHCGSGCTLGDICAEFLAMAFPVVAIWFGWKTIFPDTHAGKMFAVWILDFVFAFGIGVAFQYFTIVPMRNLSPGRGIVEAIKADTLSLISWQVGMYGFMAFAQFVIFRHVWEYDLEPSQPVFWFVMQLAMLAGFVTAYPVNWWLIRAGIKEAM